jgi:hypothetical protein
VSQDRFVSRAVFKWNKNLLIHNAIYWVGAGIPRKP